MRHRYGNIVLKEAIVYLHVGIHKRHQTEASLVESELAALDLDQVLVDVHCY